MQLESADPTSATPLVHAGLSPNDQVAWARFVGLSGSWIVRVPGHARDPRRRRPSG